jgi:hypothetical protein
MENHDKPARLEIPFNFVHQQPRLPLVYRAHELCRAVPESGSPWETRLCLTRTRSFANIIVYAWKLSFANLKEVHFPFHSIPFSTSVFCGV